MQSDEKLSVWIRKLKRGDPRTQQEIWDTYFAKLVTMTRKKLRGTHRVPESRANWRASDARGNRTVIHTVPACFPLIVRPSNSE